MANPQDLEKLCQGPEVWNAWRNENQGRIPDLTDASLTLSQRQFGPSNGGPINLQEVDLGGAQLPHATLTGADISHASLAGANLTYARLNGVDFSNTDLTDAVLDYADLTDAKLDDAILIGASFAHARGLTEAQVAGAYGNSSTALPNSLTPPQSWFPSLDDDLFTDYNEPELSIQDTDPYETLDVPPSATAEDIRLAYRGLVKKLHPDLNPGDQEALEAFKRVSIAYQILSNTEQRRRYDRGEIGGDGEVTAEYEAKTQFRRYAFRFYAAAAASLCLVVGVLAGVWHMVLTDNTNSGQGRIEIVVSKPVKQDDRLEAAKPGKSC